MTARHEQEPTIVQTLGSVIENVEHSAEDKARMQCITAYPCWNCRVADEIRAHVDALTALDTAVNGCGKMAGAGFRCSGEANVLCPQCYTAKNAAIRTLLGRTA